MKLRIQGNSLRLRLSDEEVALLAQTGRLEERIEFGSTDDDRLTYALEIDDQAQEMTARYEGGRIAVKLPPSAREWARSNEISLKSEQTIDPSSGKRLRLLVEKDLAS